MFDLLISKAFAGTPGRVADLETIKGITDWLDKVINQGISVFAFLAVGVILYAAFLFLFSGGDDKKLPLAKKLLTYSFLAIILVALVRTIPDLLRYIIEL